MKREDFDTEEEYRAFRDIRNKANRKYYSRPEIKLKKRKYKKKYDLTARKIKEIYKRDNGCVYCRSKDKLELDHITSLKRGGNSLSNNFVVACEKCNRSKSAREVSKWCISRDIKIPLIVVKLLKRQGL